MQITKPAPKFDPDAYLLAMFLMFARAPRQVQPDLDGHYDLGEIGADVEKNWERLTPYSIARPEVSDV